MQNVHLGSTLQIKCKTIYLNVNLLVFQLILFTIKYAKHLSNCTNFGQSIIFQLSLFYWREIENYHHFNPSILQSFNRFLPFSFSLVFNTLKIIKKCYSLILNTIGMLNYLNILLGHGYGDENFQWHKIDTKWTRECGLCYAN